MTLSCGNKEAFPDVPATYALGLLSSLCNQDTELYFATLCGSISTAILGAPGEQQLCHLSLDPQHKAKRIVGT